MHADQIEALRRVWGNQPCNHPVYVRETDMGAPTGDKYCSACGRMLSQDACDEIDNRHPWRE